MKTIGLYIQEFFLELTGAASGWTLLFIAFFDSSFLSLPEVNDLLIVRLSIKSPDGMIYYCSMTTIGSIMGCLTLFYVGRKGGTLLLKKRFTPQRLERVSQWYRQFGVLAVIIPAILPPPTPFKIFVLSAGALKMSPAKFILAITVGRGFRYFLEGYLAIRYGNQALHYMLQNYPTFAWGLLAIVVFGLFTFLLIRKFYLAHPPAK